MKKKNGIEIFKDNSDEWRMRVTVSGRITYSSTEGYKNKKDLISTAVNHSRMILEEFGEEVEVKKSYCLIEWIKRLFGRNVNNILVLLTFFVSLFGFSQNPPGVLHLTEFSNGSDNSKEYIEFVIGGEGDCGDYVDVQGWIIDDNNGDFGTVAISKGYLELYHDFWKNIKIGTVIVLFNGAEVNDKINYIYSNYSGNTNNDLIIQTQYNDSYFISINNSNKVSGTWTSVALNNSSDVVQIRTSDNDLFFVISYGNDMYNNTNGWSNDTLRISGNIKGIHFSDFGNHKVFYDENGIWKHGSATSTNNKETPGSYAGYGYMTVFAY